MSNLQLTQEKLDALRSEYRPRRPCALLKYPRPKTKPEYLSIYPWIILDETDPHFVFCAICECRLSAKRSDLGKHEGSIKHSENAQRKAVSSISKTQPETSSSVKWEYNDDEENLLPMQFGACKTEPDNEDDDATVGDAEAEADDDSADADADADADVDDDAEVDADYEPNSKRRVSETDSQHSGLLDYLPLQVTINEMPHAQLTPATQFTQCPTIATAPPPCRITIKKVTTPIAKVSSISSSSPGTAPPHEFTSKATITPIAAGCYAPTTSSYASRQLQSYQLQQLATPRDSFDLFFDSICATVKSLPPKLATEGKIRVMQLIGDLELRAINEREAPPVLNPTATSLDAAVVPAHTDAPVTSQQNATVASTTK